MIKRFISYYKPHKKLFMMDMLCAFFISICDLTYPLITRNIINVQIPNRNIRLVLIACISLLAIYIFKGALNYFVTYYGHIIGVRMQANMRNDVFTHMQRLPFTYFDEHKTGSLMSRIINDLMDISELAHHGPEDIFISAVMFIGSFIILCRINLLLTLAIFALIPVLVIYSMFKRRKMSRAFTRSRQEIAEVNAGLENSIAGMRVSRAFANKDFEIQKFESYNDKFQDARADAYKVMAEFNVGSTFMIDCLNIIMLSAGAAFIFYGKIDIADFITYSLYIGMFMSPIKKLISFVEIYENGTSGFKRFLEVMDTPIEDEIAGASTLSNVKGHIEFKDVTFCYDEDNEVLSNINLDIPTGSTIALVGPSGGGKTTLCHLVPRFYEIDAGVIEIDGVDIRNISRMSLRQNIGIVQQDVFIFVGSIYDNILYGKLNATEEDVYLAAKRANIHDYIITLPDGYNTQVGERGIKLSGGQKQRLSIARVFLKNPPILILDEATSALDNTTELLIQESLNELCKGRTTLVVAHRLSTIKNANEIVVITSSGVEERGAHEALLNSNGLYSHLYKAQFKQIDK